jgi:hypothetical protein
MVAMIKVRSPITALTPDTGNSFSLLPTVEVGAPRKLTEVLLLDPVGSVTRVYADAGRAVDVSIVTSRAMIFFGSVVLVKKGRRDERSLREIWRGGGKAEVGSR